MKRKFYVPISKATGLIWSLLLFAKVLSAQLTVSGMLETINGQPMTGYEIEVTGTEAKAAFTDANGHFSFVLAAGGNYSIKPLPCSENPLNGVNTFDMVLIGKHINNVELLNSPYKIIAADVDGSNSLSSEDTSLIRSLIVGDIQEFPTGNTRFVMKDYVFPDPLDPFNPVYPSSFTITNLQTNLPGIDFIGVKTGDVNMTAVEYYICDHQDFNIRGMVYDDANNDCEFQVGEKGLGSWNVSAYDGINTFFGTTNINGEYSITALPGVYTVVLSNPDQLWGACQDTLFNVVQTPQGSFGNDFGLQPEIICPAMQVELSMGVLRRCFVNHYKVQYCNTGTEVAENARIEVQFDPFFNILSSTYPWTTVDGNTYTFELGDVPAGACDDFWVAFELDCDAELGQTHCSEAHVFPDSSCAQLIWNGAALRIHGFCAGNEVQFVLTNNGADMLQASNYIVVEDIIVMTPPINNPFILQAGKSEVITVPANGATWRMEAEQAEGYPWGNIASATVEGCGTNANGSFSKGFVNKFPMDDQSPFIDIDCHENVGSYDPNDKQGLPTGVLDDHYVPLDQPIEYLIRFQNTGTDTAFTVVVLDTLDQGLDVSSVRPLGSSHPYQFNLIGQNLVQIEFPNIQLPDSTVDEAGSHGFVKFRISPRKDLQNGTIVKNKAAIYFDFNQPVITNTTWHTFGEHYLDISNVVFKPGIGLEVFPNPSNELANFLLKSTSPIQGQLSVFDMAGRVVATQYFEHNQFVFNCKELQAGCYFYKITSQSQLIAAGKLIVTVK